MVRNVSEDDGRALRTQYRGGADADDSYGISFTQPDGPLTQDNAVGFRCGRQRTLQDTDAPSHAVLASGALATRGKKVTGRHPLPPDTTLAGSPTLNGRDHRDRHGPQAMSGMFPSTAPSTRLIHYWPVSRAVP
jgi:hypothetical protein